MSKQADRRKKKLQSLRDKDIGMIRGSLIERYLLCGKEGCKCERGEKHGPFDSLSFKEGEKQRNIYVMFFDIKLPGMTGVELCRQVRKDNHIALIFAMTGYGGLFEPSDCREAGFDDCFAKPIRVEMILKVAREAFEKLDRWTKKGSVLSRLPSVQHPVSS